MVFVRDSVSEIRDKVGECENGMIKICPGNPSDGNVSCVLRGPFAVVRYVSLPIEVMRWVARSELERQKKHSS